jgi:hypothetical protein
MHDRKDFRLLEVSALGARRIGKQTLEWRISSEGKAASRLIMDDRVEVAR